MKMAVCVATMKPYSAEELPMQWIANASNREMLYGIHRNTQESNLGIVGSYQALYDLTHPSVQILAYFHDDLECHETGWDVRVLKEFDDPRVGVVGFGGGLRHGHPSLYKVPYRLPHLARSGYRSNTRDAETHGERFTGSCDVSVLDGFALVVRRELLDRCGGWRVVDDLGIDFFCYDYAICALARRFGYTVRMVGIDCHHRGGGTSVEGSVKDMVTQEKYDASHRAFYDAFRDVMPWEIEEHA